MPEKPEKVLQSLQMKSEYLRIPAEERSQFNELLEKSFLNPVSGADGMLHLLRTETDKLTVYIKVFYMQEKEDWRQYYCSLMDMTKIL